MIEFTPWIYSLSFGLIWFLITTGNIFSLISAAQRKGSTSLILFIGGVAGIISVLTAPFPDSYLWLWVPALIDPGSLPALGSILWGIFKEKHKF